ncbi:MAG TPA: glycine zipper family protein, partial [Verrucomicrobiae bacterium]|nr:glycine zipper family protein [Verrucomicrobiae bacterium]
EKAFGFDIKGSGMLLPVQVVLTNGGPEKLQVVPQQTFLVDDQGQYWPLVPTGTAVDRLQKSTELSSFFGRGAGKGALLGATAGTVLGATIGIVSGRSVGEAIGKGAVIGAAGGGLIGATSEGNSGQRERTIWDDIRDKGLEGKQIPTQGLASGFLFFPGEAMSAKELRVQFRELGSGNTHAVVLKFPPPAKQQK